GMLEGLHEVDNTKTVLSVNKEYTETVIQFSGALPDYTAMEFVWNMKRFRKDKGWNQERLAEELDIAQATIQRWEAGKRDPSHTDLARLAVALDRPVHAFFKP